MAENEQSGDKISLLERRGRRIGPRIYLAGGFLSFFAGCLISLAVLLIASALFNSLIWLSSYEVVVNKPTPASIEVVVQQPEATLAALETEVAGLSQSSSALPIATPVPDSVLPISAFPTSTGHPMAKYTIQELRRRSYPGGTIQVRSVLTATTVFTRYYIDYPSDNLTITGIMQVPQGEGPFPVIILNHGYIPRETYWSGADTWNAAAYLNGRGYLTIAPDFRSWGESDTGNSFFSTGQVIDVLNLISSLPSVAEADYQWVGIWGHSMGGGIATKAITVDPRIKAAVLYAPVSAQDEDVLARWGVGCKGGQSDHEVLECAGAEVLTGDIDDTLMLAYVDALSDPEMLYAVSPINYFDFVSAPVQIHVGTADTTTPPEWSDAIYQALQGRGKEVEYFVYPGQGHSFEGEQWQLFMGRVADFFDYHLEVTPDLRGE